MSADPSVMDERTEGPWGGAGVPADGRTTRILARSMFRDLKDYGIANDKILEVASELIGLVTADLETPPGA